MHHAGCTALHWLQHIGCSTSYCCTYIAAHGRLDVHNTYCAIYSTHRMWHHMYCTWWMAPSTVQSVKGNV
eukprot:9189183-Pyramimonas_sp.AAC.1